MAYAQLLNKWNTVLDFFLPSQKDVYFTEEYVKLYETNNEKAVCFVYNEGDCYLLFPYLLRMFQIDNRSYYDFETPYGYGGPIVNTQNCEFAERALNAFYNYACCNGYVAGFIRFHPLLKNAEYCTSLGQTISDRYTVAIDLQSDIESVWMDEIHTNNRNIIKKGLKNGLRFIADYRYDYLNEFIALYNQTMNKLNADNFYYFPNSYYIQLQTNILNSFLGITLYGDKVIAAAIFFYSEKIGHYHLSGNDKSMLKLCPNNFMLWEAAKELKIKGVDSFHLGGGTDSDEHNSLFEFKRKFSKSVYQFKIGKIIFNQMIYNKLCIKWEHDNPYKKFMYQHYLLKYKY